MKPYPELYITVYFRLGEDFSFVDCVFVDFGLPVGSSASPPLPPPLPLDAGEKCFVAIKVGARGDKDAATKRH